jgi:hypothetical protein
MVEFTILPIWTLRVPVTSNDSRRHPMSRPQRKLSTTDRHAITIATAIAKGEEPNNTPQLEQYFASYPREIFAALNGIVHNLSPAGKNPTLAQGYLFLLEGLLEHIRYGMDRGYSDATRLIADFQSHVAARVEAGRIDHKTLGYVAAALHRSRIPTTPRLAAASTKRRANDDAGNPTDIRTPLAGIIEGYAGDPFGLVGSLSEVAHAMPVEIRAGIAAELALSGFPDGRAAAVLYLLDPALVVRNAAASALASIASALSPTDVRRLIAVRNWRCENERAEIDAIVRKARAAGIDCAQWRAGTAETILATAVDAEGTQGFMVVSLAGRKKRLSPILIRKGIVEAISSMPEPRRIVEKVLWDFGRGLAVIRVSRNYLDSVLAHNLALGVEKGEPPPVGLLGVAEAIGGADWQPTRINYSDVLAHLIGELRKRSDVEMALRAGDPLDDLGPITESWFEDDPEIEQVLALALGGRPLKVATYLLQSVIARRREKWADIFLGTALWMREAPNIFHSAWRDLAIAAKAVSDGRDLCEIGLMRDIAYRTIEAFSADAGI